MSGSLAVPPATLRVEPAAPGLGLCGAESPAPDSNRRPLPYHEGAAFQRALEQGRHDQRFACRTAEERAQMDELARALESMSEQPEVPSRFLGAGFVYFIQRGNDGPIKIGFTTREPEDRMAQLQCGSPDRLRLLGCRSVFSISRERDLHRQFAEYRLTREWFAPAEPLLEYIATLRPRTPGA